jgi:hypothetical protein
MATRSLPRSERNRQKKFAALVAELVPKETTVTLEDDWSVSAPVVLNGTSVKNGGSSFRVKRNVSA